jgi:sucrose phosphorylase
MVRLLALRKQYPAFSPCSAQQVLALSDALFGLQRGEGEQAIRFVVNLTSSEQSVEFNVASYDLVSDAKMDAQFTLKPYQFVWLTQPLGF